MLACLQKVSLTSTLVQHTFNSHTIWTFQLHKGFKWLFFCILAFLAKCFLLKLEVDQVGLLGGDKEGLDLLESRGRLAGRWCHCHCHCFWKFLEESIFTQTVCNFLAKNKMSPVYKTLKTDMNKLTVVLAKIRNRVYWAL